MTTAQPLSPYNMRQWIDNLRQFPKDSGLRQIANHLRNGDITEKDANTMTEFVLNDGAWRI